eukprot:TRINITY_DN12410_c0_g1_i3.p1 TRINITY_DN12410_c0_g1~~TRINITY_DN12410_c0_g1_i3.p1  ORF type:complete len:399 (-),score=48.83 TRINITY_DN12410_c0_g1_i3:127-1323(-)
MEALEASIDEIFGKVFPAIANHAGWNIIFSSEDGGVPCSISMKPLQIEFSDSTKDVLVVQFSFVFALPYQAQPRPESMGPEEMIFSDSHVECRQRLLKLYGPGDGLMQSQIEYKDPATKMLISMFRKPSDEVSCPSTFRCIVRQDYPNARQSSMLMCPPSRTNTGFVYLVGVEDSGLQLREALPGDPQHMRCNTCFCLLQSGAVLTELLLPHLSKMVGVQRIGTQSILFSQTMAQWLQKDATFFIALTVRSCQRGLPLRPISEEKYLSAPLEARVHVSQLMSKYWVQLAPGTFNLRIYLAQLMEFLGLHIQVAGHIDGRELAPYHAILPRSCWQEAEEISTLWAEQKAAYRKLKGGKKAPEIQEVTREVYMAKAAPQAPSVFPEQELEQEYILTWISA